MTVICALMVAAPVAHVEQWDGIERAQRDGIYEQVLVDFGARGMLWVRQNDCFYTSDAVDQFERDYQRNLLVPNPVNYNSWILAHQPDVMPDWVRAALMSVEQL